MILDRFQEGGMKIGSVSEFIFNQLGKYTYSKFDVLLFEVLTTTGRNETCKNNSLEHILISDYNPNNTWHIKNKYGLIIELITISIITLR